MPICYLWEEKIGIAYFSFFFYLDSSWKWNFSNSRWKINKELQCSEQNFVSKELHNRHMYTFQEHTHTNKIIHMERVFRFSYSVHTFFPLPMRYGLQELLTEDVYHFLLPCRLFSGYRVLIKLKSVANKTVKYFSLSDTSVQSWLSPYRVIDMTRPYRCATKQNESFFLLHKKTKRQRKENSR